MATFKMNIALSINGYCSDNNCKDRDHERVHHEHVNEASLNMDLIAECTAEETKATAEALMAMVKEAVAMKMAEVKSEAKVELTATKKVCPIARPNEESKSMPESWKQPAKPQPSLIKQEGDDELY